MAAKGLYKNLVSNPFSARDVGTVNSDYQNFQTIIKKTQVGDMLPKLKKKTYKMCGLWAFHAFVVWMIALLPGHGLK